MAQDLELNKILKEMWMLDEKLLSAESLSSEEVDFYDQNLSRIKNYYFSNNEYWSNKGLLEK